MFAQIYRRALFMMDRNGLSSFAQRWQSLHDLAGNGITQRLSQFGQALFTAGLGQHLYLDSIHLKFISEYLYPCRQLHQPCLFSLNQACRARGFQRDFNVISTSECTGLESLLTDALDKWLALGLHGNARPRSTPQTMSPLSLLLDVALCKRV